MYCQNIVLTVVHQKAVVRRHLISVSWLYFSFWGVVDCHDAYLTVANEIGIGPILNSRLASNRQTTSGIQRFRE